MASDRTQREKQQLVAILKNANVHEAVQQYVLTTLCAESVADFYGLVKADDFEEES